MRGAPGVSSCDSSWIGREVPARRRDDERVAMRPNLYMPPGTVAFRVGGCVAEHVPLPQVLNDPVELFRQFRWHGREVRFASGQGRQVFEKRLVDSGAQPNWKDGRPHFAAELEHVVDGVRTAGTRARVVFVASIGQYDDRAASGNSLQLLKGVPERVVQCGAP